MPKSSLIVLPCQTVSLLPLQNLYLIPLPTGVLLGALRYLTLTRPDIAYAVQQIYLHMHAPGDAH